MMHTDAFEDYLDSRGLRGTDLHTIYKELRGSGEIGPKQESSVCELTPTEPPHIPARLNALNETLKLLVGCYEAYEATSEEYKLFEAIAVVTQAIARLSLVDFAEPISNVSDTDFVPDSPEPDIIAGR